MADEVTPNSPQNSVSPSDAVSAPPANRGISLDWTAVITALVLVLLIWLGVIQSIPW